MKKRHVALMALVIAVCGLSIFGQASDIEKIPLKQFLKETGDKYGYYFTIESALIDGNVPWAIEGRMIDRPRRITGVFASLNYLQQIIPYLEYRVNPFNRRIIFIYDSRLLKRPNYGLVKKVKDFSFDGKSTELIEELDRRGVPIVAFGTISSKEPPFVNLPTPFHIRGANRQVRNLLTDWIDLSKASRVLWIARTRIDSEEKTYVRYH